MADTSPRRPVRTWNVACATCGYLCHALSPVGMCVTCGRCCDAFVPRVNTIAQNSRTCGDCLRALEEMREHERDRGDYWGTWLRNKKDGR